MRQFFFTFLSFLSLAFLVGCQSNESIVNNVDEREANEIVVFLASKGIAAQKLAAPASGVGVTGPSDMFNISVSSDKTTDAMGLLNRAGLPRRKGTNLLTLFAPQGLMSSAKEETIRYQAGLAEELKNTIRKIDGVIDADVQISFPPDESTLPPGVKPPKMTAAVFIKHQGILDDPNSHMDVKIKRLMAGSISGLDYDNVAVVSDRARIADSPLPGNGEMIGSKALQQTYVKMWGVVMTKSSLSRFRFIFFLFTILLIGALGALGWMVYKFYPNLLQLKSKREKPD
jgi:type III secretion protein J